jgi:hypothetical protein
MTTNATKGQRISNTHRGLQRVHVKDARIRACIEAQKLNTTIAEEVLAARARQSDARSGAVQDAVPIAVTAVLGAPLRRRRRSGAAPSLAPSGGRA